MTQNSPNFRPFEDDTSSSQLDQLTLENQGDRVSLYGSLQITRDQVGLTRAHQLKQILEAAIAELEKDKSALPEQLAKPAAAEQVDNPFL